MMLEERTIDVWAYNLETVLAEKLETMISRTITNTRMRDFYDIQILCQIYGESLNAETLHNALNATAKKRGTEQYLQDAVEVFNEVESDVGMQKLWLAYQKKFSYASEISWQEVMQSVRTLYRKAISI